jgi:hypothetical protein
MPSPSVRCPRAFTTAGLQAELDEAARAFVNHPRGLSVLPDGRLRVSSTCHWFKDDLGVKDAGVIAHLRRHAVPPLAAALASVTTIAGHAYDWALNGAGG